VPAVCLPADVAAALETLDGFFDEPAASTLLGPRGGCGARPLVAAEFACRKLTAGTAKVIVAAQRDGDFFDEGHRHLRPWVKSHVNTSRREALHDVQVATIGAAHPVVISLLEGGGLGVAQARAPGRHVRQPPDRRGVRDGAGSVIGFGAGRSL